MLKAFVPALGVQRVHSRRANTAHANAGESKELTELLEVRESDFSKKAGVTVAAATASESDGNLGLRSSLESYSRHNSSWGVDVVACARVSSVPGVLRLLPHLLLLLRLLMLLHTRAPQPCMLHTIRGRTRVWYRVPREGGVQRWCFWSCRRFAPCLRGGGRGKFSAGRRCTGTGCRFAW